MTEQLVRLIKLKDETHNELKAMAKYDNTMDDIVRMLLEFYKKHQKK
jgi:hypothetical protein